jgi:Beta-propeller repeat
MQRWQSPLRNAFVAGLTTKGGKFVITGISSSGSQAILSLTLGGTGDRAGLPYDWPTSIAIDAVGDIYVGGMTSSSDFPVTPGAYETKYACPPEQYCYQLFFMPRRGNLWVIHGVDGLV